MKETAAIDNIVKRLEKVYPHLPKMAGAESVNFFKNRFRTQDWIDKTSEPWKQRKRQSSTPRGVLIQSGRLKRSIRVSRSSYNSVWISTDVPYARIHNEGGRVNTTAQVSAHSRKSYSRRRKGRKETVKAHKVKAHSRKVNFMMPKRQFMGTSAVLDQKIEQTLTNKINQILK